MLTSGDHYAEAWLGTEDDVCNSKTQDTRSLQNQVSHSPHLCSSISSCLSLFDVAHPHLRFQTTKHQYLPFTPDCPMHSAKSKQEEEKKDMYIAM